MDKYELSAKGLSSIFTKLLAAKALYENELRDRVPVSQDTVDLEQTRGVDRNYLFVTLPVYPVDNLVEEGAVLDISEKGLRVSGLDVRIGQGKELVVQADQYADILPFQLEACCRWITSNATTGEKVAGFEITSISDGSLEQLRNLIEQLSLSGA